MSRLVYNQSMRRQQLGKHIWQSCDKTWDGPRKSDIEKTVDTLKKLLLHV
mgnify:FL=1